MIEQPGQFVCMRSTWEGNTTLRTCGTWTRKEIHYQIADWVLAGNTFSAVGDSLFFYNPYSETCPTYFPPNGMGVAYNQINQHCFYRPTEKYAES